jgi:hypothetical protein
MGKYTISKKADAIIQEKIDLVVEGIKKRVPGLVAIFLAGGYGRGEGAFLEEKGKIRLVNDFDIYLITKKQLPDDFLEELGKEYSKKIGKGGLEHPQNPNIQYDIDKFFNIDFRCVTLRRLKYLPPIVRYYELRNSAMSLYGRDISNLFPLINPKNMPYSEGMRLLMNRMVALFLGAKKEWVKEKPRKDEERILKYYIQKAYLSCCESLLLSIGEFAPTYKKRAELFSKLDKEKFSGLLKMLPKIEEKIEKATKYKLNPNLDKTDYKKEWFIARKYITETLKYIVSRKIGKENLSLIQLQKIIEREIPKIYYEDYSRFMLKRLKMNIKPFRFLLSRLMSFSLSFFYFINLRKSENKFYFKSLFNDVGLKIMSLTPLVLLSLKEDGSIKEGYLGYFEKSIKSIFPVEKISSWEEMKEIYLKIYKLYYLMRFV